MWLKSFVTALCVTAPLVAYADEDRIRLTLAGASEFDAGADLCGINVTLVPESATKLYRFTSEHAGETVGVVLDGRVIQTPKIMMPMAANTLQIMDTKADAADCGAIAAALAAGASTLELRALRPAG